jgi:hypothetical protein
VGLFSASEMGHEIEGTESLLFHFSYLFCLLVGLVYLDGIVNAVFCATEGQTFCLVLVGIPEGKKSLWVSRRRGEHNIEMSADHSGRTV